MCGNCGFQVHGGSHPWVAQGHMCGRQLKPPARSPSLLTARIWISPTGAAAGGAGGKCGAWSSRLQATVLTSAQLTPLGTLDPQQGPPLFPGQRPASCSGGVDGLCVHARVLAKGRGKWEGCGDAPGESILDASSGQHRCWGSTPVFPVPCPGLDWVGLGPCLAALPGSAWP